MRFDITKTDVRRKAEESTYSLDDLIHPSDIDGSYSQWSEIPESVLNQELNRSIEVMESEFPQNRHSELAGLFDDLIYRLWREHMPRIPLDDLKAETPEKAVKKGYWPNKMSKYEVTDILFSLDANDVRDNHAMQVAPNDTPLWAYREALEPIRQGWAEGLKPQDSTE